MQGVGPGTILGGRYTTHRRLAQLRGAERWSARDGSLDREVSILCFPSGLPAAPAVLDAARRAAGVDNPRLVQVHDVGSWDGISYVVEEDSTAAHSLTSLVTSGGLPAEEVRRISGEVATGLEAATQRGLHHLGLSPASVLRWPDGSVKVAGLATECALSGTDDVGGEEAARTDAVGVVGIAYAGLTGRWPLPGDPGGLGRVGKVVGGVPAPSEIAAGVPSDLDALCRLTLNEEAGPLTPGDFAAQVAPWSTTQVGGVTARSLGTASGPDRTQVIPKAGGADEETVPRGSLRGGAAAAGAAAAAGWAGMPRAARADTPTRAPAAPETQPAPGAARQGDPPRGPTPTTDGPAAPAARSASPGETTVHPVVSSGDTAVQPAVRVGVRDDAGTDSASEASGSPSGGPGVTGIASGATALGSAMSVLGTKLGTASAVAGRAAGQAAVQTGSAVGRFARDTSDKTADRMADRVAERRAYKEAVREADESGRVTLSQTRFETGFESPAPLLPTDAGAQPSQDQSRIVLIVFSGFLILAMMFALWGVSKIGDNTDMENILGPETASLRTTPTEQPSATGGSSAEPTKDKDEAEPTKDKGGPVAILGVSGFDPVGDGSEHDSEAPRVDDGDVNTYWSSEGYFGQLSAIKSGVGVVADLGQPAQPKEITLHLPTASTATVYLNSAPTLDGATAVGSTSGRSGEVTLKIDEKVRGQYVIVWFTEISQASDGRFRATLAELQVTE